MEAMERDEYRGARPRVFVTNADAPEEGRVFVYARTRWLERVEGTGGAVTFTPVASQEQEFRQWLAEAESEEAYEGLTEIDDDFAERVRDEFLNQTPLYPEAPELSTQWTDRDTG